MVLGVFFAIELLIGTQFIVGTTQFLYCAAVSRQIFILNEFEKEEEKQKQIEKLVEFTLSEYDYFTTLKKIF
jgi:hypothetical protein